MIKPKSSIDLLNKKTRDPWFKIYPQFRAYASARISPSGLIFQSNTDYMRMKTRNILECKTPTRISSNSSVCIL